MAYQRELTAHIKCKRIILILFLFVSINLYGQKFQLTHIQSTEYSIDRIAQQVYFKDFYSDTVRKIVLKNLSVTKTGQLVLLPSFSNSRHLMLYGNNSAYGDSNKNNIYLYNLDKQSYFLITDTISFPPFSEYYNSFSPNDINFILDGYYCYSLNDSSLKPLDIKIVVDNYTNDAWLQWSSDTSIVFRSNDSVIAEYFLNSKKIDTLVVLNTNILGFAYNVKQNILAYSTSEVPPKIYFHYKNASKDSLVFSPSRDDSASVCWQYGYHGLTSLCWSLDDKKLAFLTRQFIDASVSGIYIYSIDSNRTYKATSCDDYGTKYHMQWASNDTLIYVNATDGYMYGFDVSSVITDIIKKKTSNLIQDFNLSNYPNPFNNSTRISISLPDNTNGSLYIYDISGRLIKEYRIINNGKSNYEINWAAINNRNKEVASGFYLGVLKLDNSKTMQTKTIKIIYLK